MNSDIALKDDLLPDAEAAASYLGPQFNRNKVYYMVRKGQVRCIRKGQRTMFRKSWLDEDFSEPAQVAEAV